MVSWSAYFASMQESLQRQCSFYSYGEAWYGDNKTDHQTCQVGQTPVWTVNQPLYALAKKIQWAWHDVYGQRQCVEMMGGLHIEMAMLNVVSDFLEFGLQKGSHTSRGQWAHLVTAAALFVLLCRSYDTYEITTDGDKLDCDAWWKHTASDHPQFHYWHQVMQLELLFLQFLRSQREGKFDMHVER